MKYIVILLMLAITSSCQSQSKEKLSAAAFQDKIQSTPGAVILDVRTPDEFADGSLPNAININYNDDQFESNIKKLDVKKTYFVYCLSGGRSASAVGNMRKSGFNMVYELKGGIMAWKKNDFPITTPTHELAIDKISTEAYDALTKSSNVVLIDFYAPWCGPCMKMVPLLEKLTKEYEGKATIIRINIDENKSLAEKLKIDEIPFFKLYRNGKEAGNFIGQMDRASFVRILNGE